MNTRVRVTVMLLGVTALACSRGPELETRTIELRYLDANSAALMIEPYVYADRPGAPGMVSFAENVITVRETSDNLDRIERVLAKFDRPAPIVRLYFQLIEADGAPTTDSSIADIEAALREVFRFTGYRLLADAVLGGVQGTGGMSQGLVAEGEQYLIHAEIGEVRGTGDSAIVRLEVLLVPEERQSELRTSVSARTGQTVVLGSTRSHPEGKTLILTVRPEVTTP